MTEGKFGFEPGALPRIRTELRIGADDLDKAVTRKSPPVDAGDSSDIVAEAIGRLQTIGAAIAEHLDRSPARLTWHTALMQRSRTPTKVSCSSTSSTRTLTSTRIRTRRMTVC